ncbi:MAG: hypothetical protein ACRCX4_00455 [Bacteroidales bacterium]
MIYFRNEKNPFIITQGVYLSDLIGIKVEQKIVYLYLTNIPYPIRIYKRMNEVSELIGKQQLSVHFCSCRSVTLSLYYYDKLSRSGKKASFFNHLDGFFHWKISRYVRSAFYKELKNYKSIS